MFLEFNEFYWVYVWSYWYITDFNLVLLGIYGFTVKKLVLPGCIVVSNRARLIGSKGKPSSYSRGAQRKENEKKTR